MVKDLCTLYLSVQVCEKHGHFGSILKSVILENFSSLLLLILNLHRLLLAIKEAAYCWSATGVNLNVIAHVNPPR
jgi:hypothetical protein